MNQIQLFNNTNSLLLTVSLSNGKQVQIQIEPFHALFDSDGYIRQFSLEFDDGEIGNFKLLPNNSTVDEMLDFTGKYLAPFGLMLLSGKVISGQKVVNNLARFTALNFANPIVYDVFQHARITYSSYYEISTHEHFITHPIKLSLR